MKRQLVSFDWAMKKLLRHKANFGILEGFLSELLHDDIKIQQVLESESNKQNDLDKFNRVDLLVKNQREELIIIEVQYDYEADYLQRMLYGTSKIITENMRQGAGYDTIKKVISVNIVYFDLGRGEDYVYKGTTSFIGLHKHDVLQLNDSQKNLYKVDEAYQLYPEYYILKINQFNDKAKDKLDEWVYFLKNESIKKEFSAKGLKEAVAELDIMKLSAEERAAFEHYETNNIYQTSMVVSNYNRGKVEGEKIGIEKGEKIGMEKGKHEEKFITARKMKQQKIALNIIAEITGLTISEIEKA